MVPLEPWSGNRLRCAVHSTDDQSPWLRMTEGHLSERRSVALVNGHEARISALDRLA